MLMDTVLVSLQVISFLGQQPDVSLILEVCRSHTMTLGLLWTRDRPVAEIST